MAVTITDHRTIWNEADSTTGWSATATLGTADPTPIESTGWVGYTVGAATQDAYFASTGRALHNHIVYAWIYNRTALDTTANGGLQIHIGDTTNRIGYHVAGSDRAGFQHEIGPAGWQCLVVDTANLPAAKTVRAGSEAGLLANLSTAVTQIGTIVKGLAAAPGMTATYNADIIRILDPSTNDGCALSIIGGSSGDPGTFEQIAAADRLTGNQQAHGVVRQLGAGAFGIQGPLRFGNAAGTSASWFEDKNVTVVFESRNFTTSRYKIFITDNGTGTTTFKLGTKVGSGASATGADGCNLIVPTGVGGTFDAATDTDVTDVFIYGSLFSGWTGGISLRSTHEFIDGKISASGTVTANGATMVGTAFEASTGTRALLWNVNTDTNGKLDRCSFARGASGHGIELGSNIPTSITFVDINFTGYAGSDGSTGNEAVYVNIGSGTITLNISGGTVPSIRTAGATVNVVASVTVTFTGMKDNTEVRVYRVSDDSVVDGIEDATTGSTDDRSFSWSAAAGLEVYYILHNVAYETIRVNSFTVPSDNASIPIQQRIDRNYVNP